jgi:hypothetical protein
MRSTRLWTTMACWRVIIGQSSRTSFCGVPKLLAEVLPVSVYFCDSSRSLIHGVGKDK